MLKKTITYTDYNNLERTEDHYFNLNKAEIMKMQVTTAGGLAEMLSKIVAAQDYPAIYKTFEEIVDLAYGVKSPDGKRFMKEDENGHAYYKEFKQTEAYSQLIMELATDANAAKDFVNGIIPADMSKQIAEAK